MSKYAITFIILLSGCKMYEKIGITSTATHNAHVKEAEEFYRDGIKNQKRVIEVTSDLAKENILEAKASGDDSKLERSFITMGKVRTAEEVSAELTKQKWTQAPPPSFDFSQILQLILSGLGIGSTGGLMFAGAKMLGMGKRIERMKVKGHNMAHSQDKDDITSDKDFS